jgi:hypothetical protein
MQSIFYKEGHDDHKFVKCWQRLNSHIKIMENNEYKIDIDNQIVVTCQRAPQIRKI